MWVVYKLPIKCYMSIAVNQRDPLSDNGQKKVGQEALPCPTTIH